MEDQKVWYVLYVHGPNQSLCQKFIQYYHIMETDRQRELLLQSYRSDIENTKTKQNFCSAYMSETNPNYELNDEEIYSQFESRDFELRSHQTINSTRYTSLIHNSSCQICSVPIFLKTYGSSNLDIQKVSQLIVLNQQVAYRDIYLYDVNNQEEFKHLEDHFRSIKGVMIGVNYNKDEITSQRRQVAYEEALEKAQGKGYQFMEVNIKTGNNMVEAMQMLVSDMVTFAVDHLCIMSIPKGFSQEVAKAEKQMIKIFFCKKVPQWLLEIGQQIYQYLILIITVTPVLYIGIVLLMDLIGIKDKFCKFVIMFVVAISILLLLTIALTLRRLRPTVLFLIIIVAMFAEILFVIFGNNWQKEYVLMILYILALHVALSVVFVIPVVVIIIFVDVYQYRKRQTNLIDKLEPIKYIALREALN